MVAKLFPCPFCGNEPNHKRFTGNGFSLPRVEHTQVRCESCRIETEPMQPFNDDRAVTAWNQRAPAPAAQVVGEYVVWSNEHKCWWGANHAGYVSRLADAGRYSRDEALKICVNARGGRQFNSNPTEVPLPLADAELFWPDDKEEWRIARNKYDR